MKRRYPVVTLFLGALLWGSFLGLALSSDKGVDDRRTEQRRTFVAAEQALDDNDIIRYARLKRSLKDYPLLPYLEREALQKKLKKTPTRKVSAFLKRYKNTPVAWLMRSEWLKHLAKQKEWKHYLAFYTPSNSVSRRCNYLHALIETGKAETAFQEVEPLWLSGRSQPAACDPVFEAWRKAGHLTRERIWKRVELAMEKGQMRLVRYLRRMLPKQDRAWLNTWIQVRKNPSVVSSEKLFKRPHPQREKILAYGIRRLAGRDPEEAQKQWQRISKLYSFSPSQKKEVERRLALAFTYDDTSQALEYLDQLKLSHEDQQLLE
ncbi:MAG TPA: hypothetical protein EYH03_05235, partial [Chromatiales bacterium]|nr:hypothetical protein [Chromatiales bacterium]